MSHKEYPSISNSPNRYHGPASYKKHGPNIGVNVEESISPDTSPSRSSSVVQPTTQSRRRSRSRSRSDSRSRSRSPSPSDSHIFRRPTKFTKKKPGQLNLNNLELTAPDGRAAAFRQEVMNKHMERFEPNGNSEQIENYDPKAPENFGDNPAYDERNKDRWGEPIQTNWTNKLTGNGRRSYRKQTKKRANKHKHRRQTRRKTFRNRK